MLNSVQLNLWQLKLSAGTTAVAVKRKIAEEKVNNLRRKIRIVMFDRMRGS